MNIINESMTKDLNTDDLQALINQNNILINLTGRQRMLSQKIAFLCEILLKGDESKIIYLQNTINLFDNSLSVIRNGGVAPELDNNFNLFPVADVLIPLVNNVESNWGIYKKSAENILKFASFGYDSSSISKEVMQMQIKIIENNCESLLKSCNHLVTECSNYYKSQILKTFNQQ